MTLVRLSILVTLIAGCASVPEAGVEAEEVFFNADGRRVSILEYASDGDDVRPSVLLLHGGSGYSRLRGFFERHASLLVSHGYRVYALMYYDAHDQHVMTGNDRDARQQHYQKRLRPWVQKTSDAISHISGLPVTDNKRIAILGFSQGAYIGVAVAGTDERVAAIVEKYGGLPAAFAKEIHRFPPTLIIHGEADDVVPVSEAYALAAFLDDLAVENEVKIYANAGHGFDVPPESSDADDALRETVLFLNNALGN